MSKSQVAGWPRRTFLSSLAMGSTTVALGSAGLNFFQKPQPKIGLQLYTFRKELEKDFARTLERIAQLGISDLETAFWPPNHSIYTAAQEMSRYGLRVFSVHCEIPEGLQKQQMLEAALAFNCERMVWHGWPEDPRYHFKDGTKEMAAIYNRSYQFAKTNGLNFGIHNHWWEFQKQADGHYPYQVLLEELDPEIFFELDTYWLKVAGQDPAEIVRRFGARAPLLHIKDGPATWTPNLPKDKPEPMTAVGSGTVDVPAILEAATEAEWLIVEMDNCQCDVFETTRKSIRYLTDLL